MRTAPGANYSVCVSDAPRSNGHRRPPSIAVVGGGFGGVGAVTMLRRAGYEDVTVFERGERVGGVWHHNTYPGAACDVPSHLYEFSFAPNPRWSRRYAPQAEIQAYLEDVARRHGVLDRIRTGTEVLERALGRGARHVGAADQRRPARGRRPASPPAASSRCPTVPPIPGLDSFAGPRSTPRAGATTSTSPAGAWRWSAPAAARSRSCRRSSRSSSRSTSTSARRAGRSRRWTSPTASAPSACSSASRCSSASTARRSSPSWSSAPRR